MDTTHQASTLTVEVRVDLLLEGGLVEVAGADSDTKSDGLLLCLAGHVLENSNGRVDTTSLTEERSHGSARSLGCNEDDVDVSGNLDLGEVLEDWGETVREVEGLVRESVLTLFYAQILPSLTLPFVIWGLICGHVSD